MENSKGTERHCSYEQQPTAGKSAHLHLVQRGAQKPTCNARGRTVRSGTGWPHGRWSRKAPKNCSAPNTTLKEPQEHRHSRLENTHPGVRNQQSSVGTSQETFIRGLRSHLNLINAQLRHSAQQKIQHLNILENKHDFKVLELVS